MSSNNDSYENNPLWPILVKTAHTLTMFQSHKRYVQNTLLKKSPNITAEDLSVELNIPLGEALVILRELKSKELTE